MNRLFQAKKREQNKRTGNYYKIIKNQALENLKHRYHMQFLILQLIAVLKVFSALIYDVFIIMFRFFVLFASSLISVFLFVIVMCMFTT